MYRKIESFLWGKLGKECWEIHCGFHQCGHIIEAQQD